MATFEEFFAKKKIDLQALRNEKPELYAEFQQHYHAMGEKSFDHTKKFWFNRLRKSYKLHEEDIPFQKTETVIVQQAPTTETTASSKTMGFKPKFKANITKPTEPPKTESAQDIEAVVPEQENKPSGFKPRFKAGVTKTDNKDVIEIPPPTEANEETVQKPTGFKPRFKAGVTKPAEKETEQPQNTPTSDNQVEPVQTNKPAGFKPRFKAGVTKTQSPDTENNE